MKKTGKHASKLLVLLLAFALLFPFANVERTGAATKKNVVVLYFSATGTTKSTAKRIQKATKGTLIEIKAKDPYTDDDLDYGDSDSRVTKEHESANSPAKSSVRPKISNLKTIKNAVKKADVVYIGYPIWWGEAPHIVYSLVENVSLRGKTVVSVNKSGKITAKKAGKASIVAKAAGKRLICRVTVKKAAANKPDVKQPEQTTGQKLLVAYFSWSGTSERIAQNIIAQTGADAFRIERETPYSTDYNEVAYGEAKTEADTNARPAIKNPPASLAEYDKIILCYPIWWHTAPMTVGTFLESYDFSGKNIYPISQSASMDRGQFEESVAFIKSCAKGAAVDDGLFSRENAAISAYVDNIINK